MTFVWLYLEGAALSCVWYAFFTVATWRQNPERSVPGLFGSAVLVGIAWPVVIPIALVGTVFEAPHG